MDLHNGRTTVHTPEPELLTRKDTEHGRWEVEVVPAKRGLPHTNIVEKQMKAPGDDTEMSRAIRAHEMMHAKVSPAEEFKAWIDRGIAPIDALKACEELRVNLLCQKAGFNMKEHLSDDGETADGERIAATNDWRGAVMMTIACAGTASSKKFLTGIRRHNRLWGKVLRDISKRAERQMEKYYREGDLSNTSIHRQIGIAPYGFFYTENLAEWIDRIASTAPPEPEPEPEPAKPAKSEDAGEGDEGDEEGTTRAHTNVGPANDGRVFEKFEERLKGMTPDRMNGAKPGWEELRVMRPPLSIHAPGSIGKKRIPADTGRHPRRLHRLLTDPKRRIFDRTIHGRGGVVVMDCSGSMSLSVEEIKEILTNAPGATILGYSDRGDESTNAWILAHKGKMVSEIPKMGSGNGVDHPAIEWGIKAKQRPTSPVIWISDGGVCGKNSGFSEVLAVQCVNTCLKNNVIVVEHVETAIEALRQLRMGEKPRSHWPLMLRSAYRSKMRVAIPR
jgi:hypothetical protein